ncbi:MAG TPA: hypothetical protein VGP58_04210 [Pyrinomonadaceae bacterium]|nr:hypothetical protein [Pyrinomonadaceae bacterium]
MIRLVIISFSNHAPVHFRKRTVIDFRVQGADIIAQAIQGIRKFAVLFFVDLGLAFGSIVLDKIIGGFLEIFEVPELLSEVAPIREAMSSSSVKKSSNSAFSFVSISDKKTFSFITSEIDSSIIRAICSSVIAWSISFVFAIEKGTLVEWGLFF